MKQIKRLIQIPNYTVFSKFGIGSDKQTHQRLQPIFKTKNISDQSLIFPRDMKKHAFPINQQNFINFTSQDKSGQTIKLQTYRHKAQNVENPKAILYLFHGMHGNSQNGSHIAYEYSQKGIEVLAFDHQGHGLSQGTQGYVQSLVSHLNDSLKFVEETQKLYSPDTPKFISGLSMGGMTTYLLTKRHPGLFKGAIMYAPAIKCIHNQYDQKLASSLAKIIPSKPFLPPNIYASNRVKEFCKILASEQNSGRNWFARPGTANALFQGMKESSQSFSSYSTPFLIIQGGIDKLVDPLGPKLLMEQSKSEDKQIIYIENMWHDIWHEPEIKEIIPQAVKWVEDRI